MRISSFDLQKIIGRLFEPLFDESWVAVWNFDDL